MIGVMENEKEKEQENRRKLNELYPMMHIHPPDKMEYGSSMVLRISFVLLLNLGSVFFFLLNVK